MNDRIRFGAFENTIARWQQSGKRVPVHWAHRGEASNVIGSVDPARMREVAGLGLYVEGKLDLEVSEVAREAWRSMKDNRVGLSFGYMTVKSQCRGGINDLLDLDLFEISIAPGEINPETRFLSLKAEAVAEREQRDLRRRCDEVALEAALGWQPVPTFVEPEAESGPIDAELREQAKALGLAVPPPRGGTARFRSRLDPTGEQLVKDLNAAYDRAEAIHHKANLSVIETASFEV